MREHAALKASLWSLLLLLTIAAASHAEAVKHVTTDKAMYYPTSTAAISVLVTNDLRVALSGRLELSIHDLDDTAHHETVAVALADGASQTFTFNWVTPSVTLKGYGIDADLYNGDTLVLRYSGALDVSEHWYYAPRYGHLTDAYASESADETNRILGEGLSINATAGTVWEIVKARPGWIVIHLLNLIGINNDAWRDTMGTAPTIKTNFDFKYYTNSSIVNVYLASPDTDACRLEPVASWMTGSDQPYGHYVYLTIPRLEYWDMIALKTGPDNPAASSASSYRSYIPWYTPSIDGIVDYSYGVVAASDEENGTNGQANSPTDMKNIYMSYDTNFVYVCFTINKNVTTQNDSWAKYIVSFDTDALSGQGSASSAWTRAVSFSNPHLADYQLNAWVDYPPFDLSDLQRWRCSNGTWSDIGIIDSCALDTTSSSTTIEYKIDKRDLGDIKSAKLWLEVWSTGGANTDNAQDGINNPRDDANPSDWTTATRRTTGRAPW